MIQIENNNIINSIIIDKHERINQSRKKLKTLEQGNQICWQVKIVSKDFKTVPELSPKFFNSFSQNLDVTKKQLMKLMEGTLWKWTNYLSGWQPRWFVLDSGVLTYYRTADDVGTGSKGSVKMGMCEVSVHPSDSTRLDLIVPNEAHFYLRAASSTERQRWLVALGSSKACMTNGLPSPSTTIVETFNHNDLRAKHSELRLYCDLLMQQVLGVKESVSSPSPDIQKLSEASSLLSATCDTFLHTLDECMTVAGASLSPHDPASPGKRSPATKSVIIPDRVHRSISLDKASPFSSFKEGSQQTKPQRQSSAGSVTSGKTILAQLANSFRKVMSSSEGCSLVFVHLISACQQSLSLLEGLNLQGFSNVKMSLDDHLKTVVTRVGSVPEQHCNLSHIFHGDMTAQTSLFWLMKALECLICFLRELLMGVDDIQTAANVAYSRTVKPLHTYVTQGVSNLSIQTLPQYSDFIQKIATLSGAGEVDTVLFHQQLLSDMGQLCCSIEPVLPTIAIWCGKTKANGFDHA